MICILINRANVTEGVSTDTHLSSGVPGTVDGMINAHSKYGKLPFKDVIQPAIDLAEKGFPLTASQALELNSNRKTFIDRNSSLPAFVKDSLWKEGDILIQKDLAGTLKRIRDNGRDGFYSGMTSHLLIKEMKRGNGIIIGTGSERVQISFQGTSFLLIIKVIRLLLFHRHQAEGLF